MACVQLAQLVAEPLGQEAEVNTGQFKKCENAEQDAKVFFVVITP